MFQKTLNYYFLIQIYLQCHKNVYKLFCIISAKFQKNRSFKYELLEQNIEKKFVRQDNFYKIKIKMA